MATRISDFISILQQEPNPSEEQREFNETSKETLWNDLKKYKNAIYVLSYACGCAICAGWCNFYVPFPRVLLQFLLVVGGGALFGFIVGAIVVTIFDWQKPPLSLTVKLLTLILVPAFIIALVSRG